MRQSVCPALSIKFRAKKYVTNDTSFHAKCEVCPLRGPRSTSTFLSIIQIRTQKLDVQFIFFEGDKLIFSILLKKDKIKMIRDTPNFNSIAIYIDAL